MTGDEAHHAVAVRRLRVGEQVVLTDGAGTSVVGAVASTGKRVFSVTVSSVERTPEPVARVRRGPGAAQGRPRRARRRGAHRGRRRRDRAVGGRALGRGLEGRARPTKSLARWRSTAREAAKQARRSWLPEVAPLATTDDVVALLPDADLAVVLHEDASASLAGARGPGVRPGRGRGRSRGRAHRGRARGLHGRRRRRRTPRRRGAPDLDRRRRRRRRAAVPHPALGLSGRAAPRPGRSPRRARTARALVRVRRVCRTLTRPSSGFHRPTIQPSAKSAYALAPFSAIQRGACLRVGDPVAGGVGEPDVVVGAEQPHGRRHVLVGELAVGDVVEHLAVLVLVRRQVVHALEHRTEPGDAPTRR